MNGIVDSPLNGYAPVRRLRVERNQFVSCKQSIVIGVADKDLKEQTVAPDEIRFFSNVAGNGGQIFTVRTPATKMTHEENFYYSGTLGLPGIAGWKRDDCELYDFPIDELLTNVGPTWLRPHTELP